MDILLILINCVFFVFTIIGFVIITYTRGLTIIRFIVLIALLVMLAFAGTLSVFTYKGSQDDLNENEVSLGAGIGLIVAAIIMTSVFAALMLCFEKRLSNFKNVFFRLTLFTRTLISHIAPLVYILVSHDF